MINVSYGKNESYWPAVLSVTWPSENTENGLAHMLAAAHQGWLHTWAWLMILRLQNLLTAFANALQKG